MLAEPAPAPASVLAAPLASADKVRQPEPPVWAWVAWLNTCMMYLILLGLDLLMPVARPVMGR